MNILKLKKMGFDFEKNSKEITESNCQNSRLQIASTIIDKAKREIIGDFMMSYTNCDKKTQDKCLQAELIYKNITKRVDKGLREYILDNNLKYNTYDILKVINLYSKEYFDDVEIID